MKTIYIEAVKKLELNRGKFKELVSILPTTLYIVYSIQYKNLAQVVLKELKNRVKILGFSQVLGCAKLSTKADAILLVGEARFHALNIAVSSSREVLVFDNHSISRVSKKEIEAEKSRERGKYLKFLSSRAIGILVSLKPGQKNLGTALKLQKELEKQGKKAYIFIADNIDTRELENFPIDIWINTACSPLSRDSGEIINIDTLKSMER